MDKEKAFDLVNEIYKKRSKEIYSVSVVEHEKGLHWIMWYVNCLYQQGFEIISKFDIEVNNAC